MTTALAKPTRPALRYFGGKWQLGAWVIQHFPEHYTYVEPFGGAASVLLQKEPSPIEIYNDLDGQVVNYFRVLRECPEKLIAALELTPYSRQEMDEAVVYCQTHPDPTVPDVEAARRLYVLSGQSRHGASAESNTGGGWRTRTAGGRSSCVADWNALAHLLPIAQRLKQVYIERGDALEVMQKYDSPNTLHYVDPPYPGTTRNGADRLYRHDLPCEVEHRTLATVLHGLQGMVVLSGYPCELYDELYTRQGWQQITRRARADNGGHISRNGASFKVESLWLSPSARDRQKQSRFDFETNTSYQEKEQPSMPPKEPLYWGYADEPQHAKLSPSERLGQAIAAYRARYGCAPLKCRASAQYVGLVVAELEIEFVETVRPSEWWLEVSA